jgi:hypothetical protein
MTRRGSLLLVSAALLFAFAVACSAEDAQPGGAPNPLNGADSGAPPMDDPPPADPAPSDEKNTDAGANPDAQTGMPITDGGKTDGKAPPNPDRCKAEDTFAKCGKCCNEVFYPKQYKYTFYPQEGGKDGVTCECRLAK